MLRMNRYYNGGATSFNLGGQGVTRNALQFWGHAAMRQGGFGRLASVPSGYGKPGSGLAFAVNGGAMSSYTACRGDGGLNVSMAAGVSITGQSAGTGLSEVSISALS